MVTKQLDNLLKHPFLEILPDFFYLQLFINKCWRSVDTPTPTVISCIFNILSHHHNIDFFNIILLLLFHGYWLQCRRLTTCSCHCLASNQKCDFARKYRYLTSLWFMNLCCLPWRSSTFKCLRQPEPKSWVTKGQGNLNKTIIQYIWVHN